MPYDQERLNLKEAIWVEDSKTKLKESAALYMAQVGSMSPVAKPFRGVDSDIFEIRVDHRTDTYRTVYAVKRGEWIMYRFVIQSNRYLSRDIQAFYHTRIQLVSAISSCLGCTSVSLHKISWGV